MEEGITVNSEVILATESAGGGFTLGSTVNFFRLFPSTTLIPWKIERFEENEEGVSGYVELLADQASEAFTVDFKTSENLEKKITEASDEVKVQLSKKLLELQLLQSTIFVIDIPDVIHTPEDDSFNDWRFSGKGITLSYLEDDPDYALKTEVKNQGKTLVIEVNKVRAIDNGFQEQVVFSFRFIAICLKQKSGGELDKVYYSQDPRIGVRRVKS